MDEHTPTDDHDEPDVSAEWMAPVDGDILELMCSEEVFTPDHISDEDVCRAPDAAYRCRQLVKYGLLKKYAPGMYDISDLGEQYLAGEVDPSDLEPDDE
ncbi:hypothetical protein [Natronorubrum thiooxidans]|uniref:Uncharacterized protein n=1 Tax=Natronorubrum thiooxidans TaxID=308853 RepID=A0A1N7FMU2_9EURY|nr:hypothetical protein [Natronorubrum thiooxidans]SIS01728.1 hypothetical protein SAMN05421752_107176 [Natronorubrum thiooxidans]